MKRRPRQPRTLLRVSIGLQRLGEQLAGTALSAAFAAFLVWRYMPETKGMELEEVAALSPAEVIAP